LSITVNEVDPFTRQFKTTSAQFGNEIRTVGGASHCVKLLSRQWTAQQHGQHPQVARIVSTQEAGRLDRINVLFVILESPLRLGRCGGFSHFPALRQRRGL